MKIEIVPPHAKAPAWKLAEAEIIFEEGFLEGLKLTGFQITESRDGKQLRVGMPSREYMSGGQKNYWDFVRPVLHPAKLRNLQDVILAEYEKWLLTR